MPTLRNSDPLREGDAQLRVTIPAGQVLTVTAPNGSAARVWEEAGDGSPDTLVDSTTLASFGPYAGTQQLKLQCTAGAVQWDVVAAPSSSSVVQAGGANYLRLPDGSLMPLQIMAGTPHEPTVAGVVQQIVSLDHGSDADHVEILLTLNATTGDPDTPDTALASARFASPDANTEVVKTGIIGASAGTVMAWHAPGGITALHFGLRGAGPYTVAAANVLTALQMVAMRFADALNVNTLEVRIGTATIGGGANKRYRAITVTGYSQ